MKLLKLFYVVSNSVIEITTLEVLLIKIPVLVLMSRVEMLLGAVDIVVVVVVACCDPSNDHCYIVVAGWELTTADNL